jgi:hypothetical protein
MRKNARKNAVPDRKLNVQFDVDRFTVLTRQFG